ncbi:hypothetical protein EAX61_12255 [Dokdonia sinensis]|uniref:Uncharacterized protein n=1 Tax=Dokdonia sinensis TaxID=2479847 RepID=A0A3M0GIN5_9FLAO|nr:hypothetical protein [Dokdonia sinensis]RMB57136.1 hypothetical protein EAX61_12255 [Dokdonia sinensis]
MKSKYHLPFILIFCFSLTDPSLRAQQANPCVGGSGSVTVGSESRAATSFKNLNKQLDLAEKAKEQGELLKMENNLKNARRYMDFVIKKEPEADLSVPCDRLNKLNEASQALSANKADFAKANYNFTFFIDNYQNFAGGTFENERFAEQNNVFDEVLSFDRAAMMKQMSEAQAAGKLDGQGKQLKSKLENLDETLNLYQIPTNLYTLLDQVNTMDGVKKSKMSKRVLKVVRGFAAIGGDNPTLNDIKNAAERQLEAAEEELASIYTGDFHKEHVNEIVFTKVPYKAGNEASVEINPVFEPGDAIYGTIYFGATIMDAVGDPNTLSASGKPMGTGGEFTVRDAAGLTLDRYFTDDDSGKNTTMLIFPGWDASATTYQFIVVPNLTTDLKQEAKYKNITPLQMARGLSKESPRKKKWNAQVALVTAKTGAVLYKGSFEVDLSKGEGPEYYQKVEVKQEEVFIAANNLPRAVTRNAGLEAQLLSIMNNQGFKEKFTRTIITRDWKVIQRPLEKYRELYAAFPYKTPEGKCGYLEFVFRSDYVGGWSKPQKSGGRIMKERVTCDKVN